MEVEHPGVFIEEVASQPPPISAAPTSVTAFVGSFPSGRSGVPTHVHSAAQFKQLFELAGVITEASIAVHDFFANGGTEAVIIAASTGTMRASVDELIAALRRLQPRDDGAPTAQLVCIPDMARRSDPFSDVDYAELVLRATGFCVQHRMFLIVDPNVRTDDLTDVHEWLATNPAWGSTNSAVYYPRLHTPAGRIAGDEAVAACGVVAGVMARTDATLGVWKAPAGRESLVGAVVATPVSDRDQSPLNRRSVNVIRRFDGVGTVIWGSRTGVGSAGSDARYVPVRRTALFIEHSLYRDLQWAVFEPNDEPLWTALKVVVTNFFTELWMAGAFRGATTDQAFFVRCDESTMSRADRRRGRTVLDIGFAPLRPAEFVTIKIMLERRSRQ